MSDEAVCRTAPATPGLLIKQTVYFYNTRDIFVTINRFSDENQIEAKNNITF